MTRRTRDPEARKKAILDAAAELLMELGFGGVTHRKIAERAGVSLGSTTQYFASLNELLGQAMLGMVEQQQARVEQWSAALDQAPDVAAFLATSTEEHLPAPAAARSELGFILGLFDQPRYRQLMMPVDDALLRFLTRRYSAHVARSVLAFLHGVRLQWALEAAMFTRDEIEETLRTLLDQPRDRGES